MRPVLILGWFIVVLSWYGCNSTRSVPANDKLYVGARVAINNVSSVKEKKVLKEQLNGLTRPHPNTKFLGLRIKLGIYNLFYKARDKSIFGKIRDKNGEPPALASQLDLPKNIQILQNYLVNKGYFRATVKGDTNSMRKRLRAVYTADAEGQYKIADVHFPSDSSNLSQSIRESAAKTLLKKGEPFDLDVIKAERLRIDAYLKERGYYYFNPDYLLIKTDSTAGEHEVQMYVTIKPGTPTVTQNVYHINNVYIYSNFRLNSAQQDTAKSRGKFYEGYYIIQDKEVFKQRLLAESMQFKKGDVYNRTEHNLTLNRLVNLDLFKFVKNRFDAISDDSLDAYYYLTPLPQKSLRAEFTTVTRSNNLNGSDITFSWRNRNLAHSGSHLKISAYVGSDIQFNGALRGYNTYRTGAEIDLAIPHFALPVVDIQNRGGYAPRTDLKLGYDILQRAKLYTLNSYRIQYGFSWKENIQKQHELYPVSITYVEPLNVTKDFDSLKQKYPGLDRSIQPQFILGSTYQYNYNPLASGLKLDRSFYFNGLVDLSGNIAGAIMGANVKKGDTAKISNTPFAQYAKFELEGRYYQRVGLYSNWANRILVGLGFPYGNSVELPYIKQFFIGGINSLRGFRSRAVGPGTYFFPDTTRIIPDQTGDIKFEMNTEFRPRISGPLYGALFLEAGNIWLVNDSNYTHKRGGKFTGKWLNQLAIDAGIGIRFDITVFVIRFDIGFPLRKPWLQDPWVINQIKMGDSRWRRNNLVYNLAIGYPF